MKFSLEKLVSLTNDLCNFKPFGVIFVYNLPGLPCKGTTAPDGWMWCDFPYEQSELESTRFSELLVALRYLVRKAHVRLTYRYFDGLCAIRIYLIPQDVDDFSQVDWYRAHHFNYGQRPAWHNKKYIRIMRMLISIADFSEKSFNLSTSTDLINYLTLNQALLFSCLKMGDQKEIFKIYCESENPEYFKFHLKRFVNSDPYIKHIGLIHDAGHSMLQDCLIDIYNNLKSPTIDRNSLDSDQLGILDDILNDEIPGFKSQLYNYQRRSVAKMFEKETILRQKLMPNIMEISKDKNLYFDLSTLTVVNKPQRFTTIRGGILAENMGLGKTCICLALICISKFQISQTPNDYQNSIKNRESVKSLVDTCVEFITNNSISWKQYYKELPDRVVKQLENHLGFFEKVDIRPVTRFTRGSREVYLQGGKSINGFVSNKKFYLSSTTLVVIPDNLFHQWKLEISKHIKKGFLNVMEISSTRSRLPENVSELLKYDVILISLNAFSKQFQNPNSILKLVYWKRLIIDEGHSMNSKTARVVLLAKELFVERQWAITGTPTSGLTNLHVEDDKEEYTVKNSFDPKEDLLKLGSIISNFLKIDPWTSDSRLWSNSIIKPFEKRRFNIDLQLSEILSSLIVRHTISDVENDIKLPKLHHRPVFLKPSFFDKLSINLFISVLSTNAVTSERKDADFMFHPSNKNDLRRLVTNLQKATFYWTGFSVSDVENLLNICVFSLKNIGSNYSTEDTNLLKRSVYVAKLALSNMRWRTATTVHEMGYFVSGLPSIIVNNYSSVNYSGDINVYGFPQLVSIQKFYYKNRLISTEGELEQKLLPYSQEFWRGYWKSIKSSKSSKSSARRPVSNKEEYKDFEISDIKDISRLPEWVEGFDAKLEEDLLYDNSVRKKRRLNQLDQDKDKKRKKRTLNESNEYHNSTEAGIKIGSLMRGANIDGTSSSKLTYLTLRLLENQIRGLKSIVFYEFENSAYYLTEFMDILGMNYIMYSPYIKIPERSKNLAKFDMWEIDENGGEGIVLIMDLKLASHGLTIIAATYVFFINPIWNKATEAQAIKRSHRIGQTKEVFVETLVLRNTIEEEMYYRRSGKEEKEKTEKDVELIDHSSMKEYILQFKFLRMYDEKEDGGEYSKLDCDTTNIEDDFCDKSADNDSFDNGVKMRSNDSVVNTATKVRHWNLPLFTEKSMSKLVGSEFKDKGQFELRKEMETSENGYKFVGTKKKNISLLEKLKDKRKVRFR